MHCRPYVLLALLAAIPSVDAADAPRYLRVLNRSYDSVHHLQVAPANGGDFENRPIDPIDAGGGSTVVRLGNAGCRFDLRLTFRNGRQALYRDVDACRGDVLVVRPLPS